MRHHSMSHDGQDRRRELQEIDAWYSEQIAYLLGKLDSVSEGEGTEPSEEFEGPRACHLGSRSDMSPGGGSIGLSIYSEMTRRTCARAASRARTVLLHDDVERLVERVQSGTRAPVYL